MTSDIRKLAVEIEELKKSLTEVGNSSEDKEFKEAMIGSIQETLLEKEKLFEIMNDTSYPLEDSDEEEPIIKPSKSSKPSRPARLDSLEWTVKLNIVVKQMIDFIMSIGPFHFTYNSALILRDHFLPALGKVLEIAPEVCDAKALAKKFLLKKFDAVMLNKTTFENNGGHIIYDMSIEMLSHYLASM